MIDPIADMLTCIRNASQALLPEVEVVHSKMKENIARILKQEGYLAEATVAGDAKKTIKMKLKFEGRQGIIKDLRRLSRPGLRRYAGAGEIPRILGGMGTLILTTSKGIMTGAEARKQNLGGELLCSIY
jgi:small subunit ribosomal protein S8